MYNLVVVDMQEYFRSANEDWLITNVEAIIHKAVKDDANIIFVEFVGYGFTLSRLKVACAGYAKQWTVYKIRDNAGRVVSQIVEHAKLDASAFYYVGVNLCACLLKTTRHMVQMFGKADHCLLKNGSNTCGDCDRDVDLRKFKHVKVID